MSSNLTASATNQLREKMNPYDELGLTTIATSEEIKIKYKILAQQHHPDKGGDEEVFKRIKLAYEILIDPDRKSRYDSTGKFDKEIDIRHECLAQLSHLLLRAIASINNESDDIVRMMKLDISVQILNINVEIINHGIAIKGLEKTLNKLKLKKESEGGENLLRGFIEKHIELRNQDLLTFNRRMKICTNMIEILDDYHYGDWIIAIQEMKLD